MNSIILVDEKYNKKRENPENYTKICAKSCEFYTNCRQNPKIYEKTIENFI